MNTQAMAKYVADKSKTQMIAAFVIDGRIRTMTPDERRFERMMRDYLYSCLGVYYCVPEEWVLEDIIAVTGRRLRA